VLVTDAESTPFIKHLSAFLEEKLARRLHLHSVLMDVFGLGVPHHGGERHRQVGSARSTSSTAATGWWRTTWWRSSGWRTGWWAPRRT
jgi:hypothetical protein